MKWRWEFAAELCVVHNLRNCAELGVKEGRFSHYLLDNLPETTVLSVDLWSDEADDTGEYVSGMGEFYYQMFKKSVEPYGGRAKVLRMDTVEAAGQIDDGTLDMVFIDADHSHQAVLKDISAWKPKIRKGGIMMGHDISYEGVYNAVVRNFPKYKQGSNDTWYHQLN